MGEFFVKNGSVVLTHGVSRARSRPPPPGTASLSVSVREGSDETARSRPQVVTALLIRAAVEGKKHFSVVVRLPLLLSRRGLLHTQARCPEFHAA